jgi:hypothetical protein
VLHQQQFVQRVDFFMDRFPFPPKHLRTKPVHLKQEAQCQQEGVPIVKYQ